METEMKTTRHRVNIGKQGPITVNQMEKSMENEMERSSKEDLTSEIDIASMLTACPTWTRMWLA